MFEKLQTKATVDAIVARYHHYADEWRAKGRVREAEAMEDIIARLKDGRAVDPRTKEN